MLFRSTHSLPLSSALSPSRCLSPPHHSHHIKCALSQSVSPSSTPVPPYQVRSLPVHISLPYTIPFHSQVRSHPIAVSLPHTIPTLSSALSPSRCLLPPLIPVHYQVRPFRVGISLLHSFLSTLKCALSQSASLSSTPFPPILKCALSQSVSDRKSVV